MITLFFIFLGLSALCNIFLLTVFVLETIRQSRDTVGISELKRYGVR
jgi:hypothetical protein